MINAIQEAQWAYLLDPCFELSNSAGKPLTGGYIEVYIHGTRTKYYCASDFDGTLHPFQIPLDSLGANIVLASPNSAYDVYVYNKFGSLVMSRYNVTPVRGGKGGSSFDIESSDGSVIVTEAINPDTGVKTYDLSVPTASAQASYWVGVDDTIQGHVINDTYVHVLPISQTAINRQGKDIAVDSEGKFNLKKGVYFWTVNVDLYSDNPLNTYQQVYVYSSLNRAAYKMDMTRDNMHSISFSGITTAPVDGTAEYFSIETEGQPIRATIYQASIHRLNQNVLGSGSATQYTPGQYISIDDDNVISVTGLQPAGDYATEEQVTSLIQEAVTGIQPGQTLIPGEYVSIDGDTISVTGLQPAGDYLTQDDLNGYATETYVDNSVSAFVDESTVSTMIQEAITGIQPGQILEPGQYISIEGDVISVTGLQPEGNYATEEFVTSQGYATETYVDNSVSSFLNESQVTAIVESAVSGKADKSEIPSLDGYATEQWVTSQGYLTEQVQSDWDETVTGSPAYIQNKPEEIPLIEGRGINIDETASGIEISCTVTSLDGYATEAWVTGQGYATESWVTSQGYLTEQVQSDWDETVTGNPAYILNKPETEEVEFEEIDLDDFARVSAIPSLDGYATEDFVTSCIVEAVSAVTGIGDYGEFYTTNVTGTASVAKVKGTIAVSGGKIQLKQGQSYHVTVRGRYNQGTVANESNVISYVEYITSNTINVNVDSTVTSAQYFDISYDLYKLNSDTDYQIAFSGLNGTVNDVYIDIHAIGSVGVGQGGGGSGTEYDQGWGIRILNHVISVNPDIIATVTGVNALIQNVTATIPEAQVQSDWTEAVTSSPAFIKHKPEETLLIEGSGINIEETANGIEISCTVTGGGSTYTPGQYISIDNDVISVTGLQPAGNYATEEWVTGQGYLKNQVQSDWTELDTNDPAYILHKPEEKFITAGDGINITESATGLRIDCTVTGGGGAQVQSDWAVTATNDPAYILNKPTEKNLVAGTNVTITESGDEVTIETTEIASGLNIKAGTGIGLDIDDDELVISVTGNYLTEIPATYATDAEVTQAVTGATQNMVSYTGNTAINHIQLVSTLPGSPDANTLYLIPEAQ